jgi:uncharacterized lipoprotein YmbA
MRIAFFLIAAALTLAACSSEKAPPPQAQTPQVAQPTVFDAQLKALDKAKGVQKTMDQRKVDLDKKLKEEGG